MGSRTRTKAASAAASTSGGRRLFQWFVAIGNLSPTFPLRSGNRKAGPFSPMATGKILSACIRVLFVRPMRFQDAAAKPCAGFNCHPEVDGERRRISRVLCVFLPLGSGPSHSQCSCSAGPGLWWLWCLHCVTMTRPDQKEDGGQAMVEGRTGELAIIITSQGCEPFGHPIVLCGFVSDSAPYAALLPSNCSRFKEKQAFYMEWYITKPLF